MIDQLRRWLLGTRRWVVAGSAILVVALLLRARRVAYVVFRRWGQAEGYEYEWVAGPLADGHGFAFENSRAWLGPYGALEFSPTAWVEPIPTMIIAAGFFFFGDGGRLLLVLLNLLWIALAALVVVLCLGRKWVAEGIFVALLFLLYQVEVARPWLYIGNTALATVLFALIALLLFRSLDRPTLRMTVALGLVIGVTNLVHAGSLLFGAVAAALVWYRCRPSDRGWRHATLLLLLPLVLLSPWTIRNYYTFGEFVPVRTSFGWNLYMGNPALAMTLAPAPAQTTPPPWSGASAREVVDLVRNVTNERALRRHATELALASTPADYSSMNEAQRDAYFASVATRWIRENPVLVARLIAEKVRAFLFGWSWPVSLVTVLAIVGALFNLRDPRAVGLALLVATYTIPYALAVPFYVRYRVPIDPFLYTLIGLLVVKAIVIFERRRMRADLP